MIEAGMKRVWGTKSNLVLQLQPYMIGDHAVERGPLETETLFASGKCPKVLRSLGDDIRTQFHDDSSKRGAVSSDVKENTREWHSVVVCKQKFHTEVVITSR